MHLKPKKSLGQNFLVDKNIQRKLIAAYRLNPSLSILEIGAGTGDLTRLITEKSGHVYALELDPNLYNILKEKTQGVEKITVINKDILKFNLKRYFASQKEKIEVVGNIPYYITSPIIEHLIKYRERISDIFITVQKEYAARITADPGSKLYGSFSCFVQYYFIPKILFIIKRMSFYPAPKIDSCLLHLKVRETPAVKVRDERLLFKIIRAAFNQRRKTLKNSLRGIIPEGRLALFFRRHSLDPAIRPERLQIGHFADLVTPQNSKKY